MGIGLNAKHVGRNTVYKMPANSQSIKENGLLKIQIITQPTNKNDNLGKTAHRNHAENRENGKENIARETKKRKGSELRNGKRIILKRWRNQAVIGAPVNSLLLVVALQRQSSLTFAEDIITIASAVGVLIYR